MRPIVIAAVLLALGPSAALAQSAPRLFNPADADRDGVVTEEERADFLARKASGVQDQPPTLGVGAPKPGGNDTIILGKSGADPDRNDGPAGGPPAAASDFEKTTEAGIRKKDD